MTQHIVDPPATPVRIRFRLAISLVALLAWVLIPALTPSSQAEPTGLAGAIADGPAWGIVLAAVFALVLVLACRWRDIGLNWPFSWRTLTLLWLPAIYLLLFAALIAKTGLPPLPKVGFIVVNTAFAALSEELMFRGVLFSALRTRLSLLPAAVITTLVFGGAHLLNIQVMGALWPTIAQAVAAAMTGLLFLALRVRTGSLLPVIVLHAVWDSAALLAVTGALSQSGAAGAATPAPALPDQPLVLLGPLLFALPNFLYALFLLRRAGRAKAATTAAVAIG